MTDPNVPASTQRPEQAPKKPYLVHVTDAAGSVSVLQVKAESLAGAEAVARETVEPTSTILLVEKGPLTGKRAADIGLIAPPIFG